MANTPPDHGDDADKTVASDNEATIDSGARTTPSGDLVSDEVKPLPASVGSYLIRDKLGEGGMGVVYRAEQQTPRREVAVKVVRGGRFVDDVSVRLFQREAEILGRLDHPGIGAIYESGRTEEGQHFFAMELVRGDTLSEYRRKKKASTVQQLKLFRSICDAVSYAHQRGVIHRDLKPSNVIITENGEPKVLDFGLARLTDTDTDTFASLATETGAIKGTLPYMSPEQASGSPDQIDLRSDVYALGVILYEMLSGCLPYDTARSSLVEAVRVIQEEAPARLTSVDSELETIARKALEKSPEQRYQSVSALSEDVHRYLTNQPILARPPSASYQLKKLVARHKLPFAFAGTLVLLLVGFGAWMSVLYAQAESAFRASEVARQESDAVTDFLADMLTAVQPEQHGNDVRVRQVLDEAATDIEGRLTDQPLVRSRLMITIGNAYETLGLFEEGQRLFETSLSVRQAALPPDHPDVAAGIREIGMNLRQLGDFAGARARLEEALAIQETVLGPDHRDLAPTMKELATVLRELGENTQATLLAERGVQVAERTGRDLGGYLTNLAVCLRAEGEHERALEVSRRALAAQEETFGPRHRRVAGTLLNLGNLYMYMKDYTSAQPYLERALSIWREVHEPDHPDIAYALSSLGALHKESGEAQLALQYHEQALAIREKALGPEHPVVALDLFNVAGALAELGDPGRAAEMFKRVLEIDEKTYGPDHPYVADDCEMLASAYRDAGNEQEAARWDAREDAIREKLAEAEE